MGLRLISACFVSLFLTLSACSSIPRIDGKGKIKGPLNYHALMLMNYDQMKAKVDAHLNKFQNLVNQSDDNEAEALGEVRAAMRLILARPNTDNMVAKLAMDVRRQISGYTTYADLLSGIASETIQALDPSMGLAPVTESTYLFMLDNLMAEAHPEMNSNPEMKAIFVKIRDAHIKLDPAIRREREMSGMFRTQNPSKVAALILKKTNKK